MPDKRRDDESWTFLHVNDNHMGTARSYRFRPAINRRWAAIKRQMAAIDASFLLHGGDLTRDGETHEFEYRQARDDLDELPFPTFVIPGNMDVGNKHAAVNGAKPKWEARGWAWNDPDWNMTEARLQLFASYFGPIHWTFLWKGVRFTGFFAAVAGSGLPQESAFLAIARKVARVAAGPAPRGHDALLAVHGATGRTCLGSHQGRRIRQLVLLHRSTAPGAALATPAGRERRVAVLRPRPYGPAGANR